MAEISASFVCSRAQDALSKSPLHALRELRVEHEKSDLLIRGQVSSFYHKQLAQEAVRSACKDIKVINSIRVE